MVTMKGMEGTGWRIWSDILQVVVYLYTIFHHSPGRKS